jgi:hypothetical protein
MHPHRPSRIPHRIKTLAPGPWRGMVPTVSRVLWPRRKRSEAEQELEGLAEDWIALWQSEIAGLMADPELAQAWSGLLGWAPPGYGPWRQPRPAPPAGNPPPPRPSRRPGPSPR